VLLPTAIHLAFYCRDWPAPLWWPPDVVESAAGEEVALLQANYPRARRARGFTSPGNGSGGKGGHGWIIVGSAVPHTLPSAFRAAAVDGGRIPFRHGGFMHS